MKKYMFFFLAAATLIGCSKEQVIEDTNIPEAPAKGKLVSFTAEIPDFNNPETKATVDGTSFEWQAGDEIAVPVKDGDGVSYVNFVNSAGALNTFTYSVTDEEFVAGTAYYPASSAPGGSYSTTFASVDAAKAGFKMTAPYTLGATSLTFTHQSALIHLQFTNVPSIATKLVVNDGSSDVAVINFTSPTSTMEFDVPITPNGSKTYTFKLQENSNVLKQVSKTATLAADTYYTTPSVALGHILRVQDATDWATRELYIWNGSSNALFTVGNSYPYQLLSISSTDHYIVIPSELAWATETTKVGVKFQDSGAAHSTQTDGIYPNRDILFEVPAGLGMKTDYRVFPRSSSLSSISVFVTLPLHFYVYNKAGWENVQIYTWSNKSASDYIPTAWSSVAWTAVNDGSTLYNGQTCKELSFESNLCGGASESSGLIIGNLGGVRSGDLHTGFVGDIFIEFDGASSSITEFKDAKRISSAWPGTSVSSLSAAINTNAYYAFDSAQYGQEVWVVFSESGSNQKKTWVFTVNQDYDYNLD